MMRQLSCPPGQMLRLFVSFSLPSRLENRVPELSRAVRRRLYSTATVASYPASETVVPVRTRSVNLRVAVMIRIQTVSQRRYIPKPRAAKMIRHAEAVLCDEGWLAVPPIGVWYLLLLLPYWVLLVRRSAGGTKYSCQFREHRLDGTQTSPNKHQGISHLTPAAKHVFALKMPEGERAA